jgi:glycosyltransferase involved in cell wall biosynthesis
MQSEHTVKVVSPCKTNIYRELLELEGVDTCVLPANDPKFDEFILYYKPEVVIFDRFMIEEQFGWRVALHAPNALRILDTIDLHFLRVERQNKTASVVEDWSNIENFTLPLDHSPTRLREISAIFRSDLAVLVSWYEYECLIRHFSFPSDQFAVIPIGLDPLEGAPDFESRKNIAWIGNGKHPPNVDSLHILLQAVWPKLKVELESHGVGSPRLHIFGAYLPSGLFKEVPDGVDVLGRVEDATKTLANFRLTLAPLRFGAGIKGKVLDSWASGTPCVTTAIGVEGLTPDKLVIPDEFYCELLAANPDEMVERAVTLYTDKIKWNSYQSTAISVIKELFSVDLVVKKWKSLIKHNHRELSSHRFKNVIGAALWQQQIRSTEYFSRWIEEKNAQRIHGTNKKRD